VCVFRV